MNYSELVECVSFGVGISASFDKENGAIRILPNELHLLGLFHPLMLNSVRNVLRIFVCAKVTTTYKRNVHLLRLLPLFSHHTLFLQRSGT